MSGESGKLVRRAMVLGCVLSLAVLPVVAAAQESSEVTESAAAAKAQGAVHEVRRGDTLWDLAGVYLGSPFLWPRIFESNRQVVEDPHWIYPGEILALPGESGVATADASAVAVERLETWDTAREQRAAPYEPPPGRGESLPGREVVSGFGGSSLFDTSPDVGSVIGRLDVESYGDPVLVSESDFYRAPLLIREEELSYTGRTVRKLEGNPLGLRMPAGVRVHDLVIIELDALDVVAGDELRAIRWATGLDERRIARSVAMLDVLDADGETARARVTRLFDDYQVGDIVMLAEGFDVPETLGQAVDEDGLKTVVAGAETEQPVWGEGDMIFLEMGSQDGVGIGDEFLLFDIEDDADARASDRLATARIVRVTPETSTARIVDLRDTSPQRGSAARRVLRGISN
ncbi:MAG: LysM peptidoglycan-binding domain-containing protein [Gemmatimonadota bacterium]